MEVFNGLYFLTSAGVPVEGARLSCRTTPSEYRSGCIIHNCHYEDIIHKQKINICLYVHTNIFIN